MDGVWDYAWRKPESGKKVQTTINYHNQEKIDTQFYSD
jgi:hypothetical protein